jgi:hypothetical protein
MPDVNNLKEEGFTLIHGFRGFSPWLLCQNTMAVGAFFTSWWTGSRENKKRNWDRYNLQRNTPSESPPP